MATQNQLLSSILVLAQHARATDSENCTLESLDGHSIFTARNESKFAKMFIELFDANNAEPVEKTVFDERAMTIRCDKDEAFGYAMIGAILHVRKGGAIQITFYEEDFL